MRTHRFTCKPRLSVARGEACSEEGGSKDRSYSCNLSRQRQFPYLNVDYHRRRMRRCQGRERWADTRINVSRWVILHSSLRQGVLFTHTDCKWLNGNDRFRSDSTTHLLREQTLTQLVHQSVDIRGGSVKMRIFWHSVLPHNTHEMRSTGWTGMRSRFRGQRIAWHAAFDFYQFSIPKEFDFLAFLRHLYTRQYLASYSEDDVDHVHFGEPQVLLWSLISPSVQMPHRKQSDERCADQQPQLFHVKTAQLLTSRAFCASFTVLRASLKSTRRLMRELASNCAFMRRIV